MKSKKRIVLAYSGGLDTSIILKWLQENYNAEVICYTADIGQKIDRKKIISNAKKFGVKNIIINDLKDIFVNKKETAIFSNEKIDTKNTHGTGCTLSSAIATYYGCGKTLKKSCELGIRYVNNAIKTRPNFGKGNGPINHLNSFTIDKKFR